MDQQIELLIFCSFFSFHLYILAFEEVSIPNYPINYFDGSIHNLTVNKTPVLFLKNKQDPDLLCNFQILNFRSFNSGIYSKQDVNAFSKKSNRSLIYGVLELNEESALTAI